MSLPVILAVEGADETERTFWRRTIEKGDQRDGDLDEALALMGRHGALERTRDMALEHGARARAALEALPGAPMRDMLIDLSDFVVARAV